METTHAGFVNRNGQVVIRKTERAGTDRNARVVQLGCGVCGHVYGANSTDVWERLCPRCQGGRPGLEYMEDAGARQLDLRY